MVAVDPDRPVRLSGARVSVQPPGPTPGPAPDPPPWGLDRVDQRALPLSNSYTYPAERRPGVTAYVIDTGILATHDDFGGRVRSGYTRDQRRRGTDDCNGHGTHVAGTIAGARRRGQGGEPGRGARPGLHAAPAARPGSSPGWTGPPPNHAAGTPAVANLSLGGGDRQQPRRRGARRSVN